MYDEVAPGEEVGKPASETETEGRVEYQSAEDLFAAVRGLIGRLDAAGHHDAASELRSGFALLNGLTDGWAMFLQSIEKVRRNAIRSCSPEDRGVLDSIRADVRRAVHRR